MLHIICVHRKNRKLLSTNVIDLCRRDKGYTFSKCIVMSEEDSLNSALNDSFLMPKSYQNSRNKFILTKIYLSLNKYLNTPLKIYLKDIQRD